MIIELLATIFTGFFAGAASFISLVEHPARMAGGPELAIREFRPSFTRAALPMAYLALAAFLLGAAAWVRSGSAVCLVAGLVMVANGPWTLVLLHPINRQLMNPGLELGSPRAAELIARWGHLHAVRSCFGCIGFVMFVFALATR